MGLEATSWTWLRDGLRKVERDVLLERVENGVVFGMADVNYIIRRVEGWIELKAQPLPKRSNTIVLGRNGLNLDQINWHLRRGSAGGRTWVFVTAAPYRWLVRGRYAQQINEWSAHDFIAQATFSIEGRWDLEAWTHLATTLSGAAS